MGVIWTSKTRLAQPQSLVRPNWASTLTNGLITSSLPTQGLIDVVTGERWTTWGTAPSIRPSKQGVAWDTTAAFGGLMLQSSKNIATAAQTHILLVETTATSGIYAGLVATSDSSGATGSVSLQREGSDTAWYSYGSSAGPTWTLSTAFGPSVLVFTGDSTGLAAYLNGVSIGSDAGNTPAAQSSSRVVLFGERSASATYATKGRIYGYWGFNRRLTLAEIAALSKNPWQLFVPEKRPLFFSTGGGGSTVTGAGSSDGVGTASGVGASTSAQVGSSAGTGTASGVGASTAASVGASAGVGAASGVGSSTGGSDGVGSASGTGTATGVGVSTASSTGSTSGVGTGTGVGASTAASTGSASGTGTASGVGTNGSVVVTGVGSASGTGTATGISPFVSHGGGKTFGSNKKKKKQRKAIESEEWLKAEETAKQLLQDRFTKTTPEAKLEALASHIESLQPVIEALKALAREDVQEAVQETRTEELTEHQLVLNRFDALEKKIESVEELLIILMADL